MIRKAMKVISKASAILFFGAFVATGLSCTAGSGPGHLAPEYATPEGDEVAVSCPPEVWPEDVNVLTPMAEVAERATQHPEDYPPPLGVYITPPPRDNTGTVAALIPPYPFSGEPGSCVLSSNYEHGSPFGGFFANEAELDRLGRLCGCDTTDATHDVSRGYFSLRVDLYLTTTGAREGFRMESDLLQRAFEFNVENVDQARLENLGDERIIKQDLSIVKYKGNETRSKAQQALLARWHNIVARIELSPYQPTEMLLDYAEQLGRNIEAAAKNATPTPQ
jgi:hypothetical protein